MKCAQNMCPRSRRFGVFCPDHKHLDPNYIEPKPKRVRKASLKAEPVDPLDNRDNLGLSPDF